MLTNHKADPYRFYRYGGATINLHMGQTGEQHHSTAHRSSSRDYLPSSSATFCSIALHIIRVAALILRSELKAMVVLYAWYAAFWADESGIHNR